jgi:redox-sensing transcriptional repressor
VGDVLLVGGVNLGRALSAYKGFNAKGFRLVAIFDADPAKVGRKLGPFVIQPIGDMGAAVQKQQIRLAMIAVPADNAQEVVDQLVSAGVQGILNFAPTSVTVPPHIALNAVDLSVQLEQLSFQLNFPPLGQVG